MGNTRLLVTESRIPSIKPGKIWDREVTFPDDVVYSSGKLPVKVIVVKSRDNFLNKRKITLYIDPSDPQ